MKITGSQYQQLTKMYQKKNTQHKEGPCSAKNDKLNLSREGQELKRIHEVLNQTPDIRLDRVKQLKLAVQQGTYEVKSEQIAEKMLEGLILNKII